MVAELQCLIRIGQINVFRGALNRRINIGANCSRIRGRPRDNLILSLHEERENENSQHQEAASHRSSTTSSVHRCGPLILHARWNGNGNMQRSRRSAISMTTNNRHLDDEFLTGTATVLGGLVAGMV